MNTEVLIYIAYIVIAIGIIMIIYLLTVLAKDRKKAEQEEAERIAEEERKIAEAIKKAKYEDYDIQMRRFIKSEFHINKEDSNPEQ